MLKDLLLCLFETLFKTERIYHSPAVLVMEISDTDGQGRTRFVDENIVTTAVKKLMPRRMIFTGRGEPSPHPAFPELNRYARSQGVITEIGVPAARRPGTGAAAAPEKKDAVCLTPWTSLYVDVQGQVSPCSGLYKSGIRAGNVLENSRDELLNGPVMACIRRGFRQGKVSPACEHCPPGGLRRLFRLYCRSGAVPLEEA